MRSRRRRRSRGSALARFGALGAGVVLAAIAVQVQRELSSFAARASRLQSRWTTIPAIARWGSLRMHARIRRVEDSPSPPIVMVHGYGIASSYFVPVAAAVDEDISVFVPDLPGHGQSDHDGRPLTIPELAHALALWMQAADVGRAVLVGHSMGCQVVAEVAATHPDLVAGIVLIGPTADIAARSSIMQIARAVPTGFFERPSFYIWAAADYFRAGIRVLRTEMREMVSNPIEQVLGLAVAPARVVRGTRDFIVPQRWAETVSAAARSGPPVLIRGWGHAAHYGNPEAVAGVVVQFARACRR